MALKFGWIAVDARADISPLEQHLARRARALAVAGQVATLRSPLPPSEENLIEGAEHFREYCSQCHGGSDTPSALAGAVFYPPPPDLKGLANVREEEIFWYAKRGIRVTGMPSFQDILSDEALWQISLFLKRQEQSGAARRVLKNAEKSPSTLIEYVVDNQRGSVPLREQKQ